MTSNKPLDDSCCSSDLASIASRRMEEEDFATLCRALAHPARIHILRLLRAQDSCIAGDLAAAVDLAPSTVSQHLKSLKEAGWIEGEVDGPRRCYRLAPETRARFTKLMKALI